MSARSLLRGHEIEYLDGEWVYSDTKDTTVLTHHERPCGFCNKHSTPEGHDACLGTLPGIMNACCGHGQTKEAYVQFMDGVCIRGDDAATVMDVLRKHRTNEG